MSVILPLVLLAVVIILLALMPWHRPHPNHLFFFGLLQNRLLDASELSRHSAKQSESENTSAAA